MNHIELHEKMSKMLTALEEGTVNQKLAREYFNGAGKLIANCKNELIAVSMGGDVDVPLLGLTSDDLKLGGKRLTPHGQ